MSDISFTASEVCRGANCSPATLRSWHNRLGLLPRADASGWRRYSAAEALQVCVVARLTSRGVAAADAVKAANLIGENCKIATLGAPESVLIGHKDGGGMEAIRMPGLDGWKQPYKFTDAKDWMDDPVVFLVKLDLLWWVFWSRLNERTEGEQ